MGVRPEEPPSSGFDVREGLGGDGTEGTPQHLEVPRHVVIKDIIITQVAVGDVRIYTNKTGQNLIIIQLIFIKKTTTIADNNSTFIHKQNKIISSYKAIYSIKGYPKLPWNRTYILLFH